MTKHVLGLNFDPVRPTACHGLLASDGPVHVPLSDFPPSYVTSSLPEGPLELDFRWPASHVGTGLECEPDPHARRVPLAYAFELLLAAPDSLLECAIGRNSASGPTVAEALGVAAEVLLESIAGAESRSIAVVVPNAIQEAAQDRLLRGMRRGLLARGRNGDKVSLVWRPVAAALQWIEKIGQHLPKLDGEDRTSIGKLLHVHLGFDAWESTVLEVVRYQRDGCTWIVPGRRKPLASDLLLQMPLGHLEALARSTIPAIVMQPTARQNAMAWYAYWLSPFLSEVCGDNRLGDQHIPWLPPAAANLVRHEFLRRIQADTARQPRWIPPLRERESACTVNLSQWRQALDNTSLGLLGAVVTGPMARIPSGASTLGAECLTKLGVRREHGLLDAAEDRSLLAEGAFTVARRRQNGEPTYLDTLPKVATILNVRGEPAWHDLLADEHEWVLGGETWRSRQAAFRYQIDRGQRELELVIHREGAPTCRKVAIQFEQATTVACPVALNIEMEPGQGNPRVEVVPEDRRLFRGRRLQLDWTLAMDTQRTPEMEIAAVPREFPNAEPRGASRWQWHERSIPDPALPSRGLRSVVADYLAAPARWIRWDSESATPRNLRLLRKWFRWPRPGDMETAVSSEGRVCGSDADQQLLDRFIHALVDRIPGVDQPTRRELLVILGSTSTGLAPAMALLRSQLAYASRSPTIHDRRAIVYACGSCFRAAEDCELLYQRWDSVTDPDYVDAEALAYLVLYRETALAAVVTTRVESWLGKLCNMLYRNPSSRHVPLPLSRAALAIGCLMRRRIWDSSLLAPGTSIHGRVKAAVSLAKKRLEFEPSTPAARRASGYLQVVMDYIDRRGRGRLSPILQDDEEAEREGED